MSYALDTNVLLYASDTSSPVHDAAVAFLDQCSKGPEPLYLAWQVVIGYLRVATHAAIFNRPLAHGEAVGNIEALLRLRHVHVLTEEGGFWDVYRKVAGEFPVRGNLVPDVHLAALLLQHGVRVLYTRDRDFLKFSFLEVRDPFVGDG